MFPTFKEFVRTNYFGVNDDLSENAYKSILEMTLDERRGWLREYANRNMLRGHEVAVDPLTLIQACSVAELHRFVDVKA